MKYRNIAIHYGHNKKGPGRYAAGRRRGPSRLVAGVPYVRTLKHPHARKK